MQLTWRERLEREPEWADIQQWTWVDADTLPSAKRKRYRRNLEAMTRILQGEPLNRVAHTVRVHPSRLTRLCNRCLGGNDEEAPALARGLIPGVRLRNSQRHKALSTLTTPAGAAHAFKHLLDTVPGLKAYLDKLIKQSVRQSRRGQNLTPKAFHAAFIRYLKGMNWPQDTYPFSVPSEGYETLRTYLKEQIRVFSMPKTAKRRILPSVMTSIFCSEIEIDEYTVDCHGSVVVELNGVMQPLRLARVRLITARDVGTGCVLASTLSLTKKVTQDDMLSLLGQLVTPWEPLQLTTPGLAYPPGGCFPSALGEIYRRVMIGLVRLDNDLSHMAHSVRHYICNVLGGTLNLGLVKYPLARHTIEQAFARLNVDIHRLPSTTGSHPKDPLREPARHQTKAPVISFRVLEEIISVLLVEHNVRTVGSQGGASALAQVQYQVANLFLPLRSALASHQLNAYIGERQVTIRQNKHHRPHIHFEGVRYKGDAIEKASLINQPVTVRFDRRDIRTLDVITLEGEHLGTVFAAKSWQRFAHSLTTRKYILQLVRQDLIERDDLLGGYFDYTLDHRKLPSKALELVRINREFGQGASMAPPNEPASDNAESVSHSPASERALKTIPPWRPDMVTKRK